LNLIDLKAELISPGILMLVPYRARRLILASIGWRAGLVLGVTKSLIAFLELTLAASRAA
jgi:hypothetical protein